MQKGKKRTIFEIIDDFYSYIRQFDQVHLSDIRRNVVSSPSDRHIIKLIAHIQDRPYLYIKNLKPNGKPKDTEYSYTVLKLGVHAREPKVRYVQAPDVIGFIEQKQQELKHKKETYTASQHKLLIEEYSIFVDNILERVVEMRDNVAKYIQE